MIVPPMKDCTVVMVPSRQFSRKPDGVLPVVRCEVEATAAATLCIARRKKFYGHEEQLKTGGLLGNLMR